MNQTLRVGQDLTNCDSIRQPMSIYDAGYETKGGGWQTMGRKNVDSWHEIAWRKWHDEGGRGLPENLVKALGSLTQAQQAIWLLRFSRPLSPCAKAIVEYLKPDQSHWYVAPSLEWDIMENDDDVLIAYPDPWGEDPLAMAAIGLIWAGNARPRLEFMAQKLGTAAILACYEGQLPYTLDIPYSLLWQSYVHKFGLEGITPAVQQFFTQAPSSAVADAGFIDWGTRPSYEVYLDELNHGVVPHETSGESPESISSVLQALHYVPGPLRQGAALLAYKAIEGRILTDLWRKAAVMTRQNEVDSW